MTQISGKLVAVKGFDEEIEWVKNNLKSTLQLHSSVIEKADFTIELPPVDVENVKLGDKVWVEARVYYDPDTKKTYLDVPRFISCATIIAHFPNQPEEKKEIEGLNLDSYSFDDIAEKIDELIQAINEIRRKG